MKSTLHRKHTRFSYFAICFAAVLALLAPASATENGASVYPVGVETVMTGMQPHPGQTMIYNYDCFYSANEFDDSHGHKEPIDFKLRVAASAVKVTHNWGWRFLGGTIDSQVAVPFVYQQLHVPPGKFTRFSVGNVDLIPFSVANHKGIAHWYYELDFFAPGARYVKTDVLNIGQHNFAAGPVAGFTLLPNRGRTEISSRWSYLINGYDKDTHYHSGNEFFTEFNADQSITKKIALGVNGAFYQQTTDDYQSGIIVGDGSRGRDLQIGPQLRYSIGHHGGFAFKYYRDTLVQNKPRGNAFWFQIALPFHWLSSNM
jgi:hypothetical protein